jgi:NAD+ kinase
MGAREIRKVLVVYKTSQLERYADLGALAVRANPEDPDVAAIHQRLESAHEEHESASLRVEAILARHHLEVMISSQPRKREADRADLVISVGGDGTFLWCSHKVNGTPILGVNSSPRTSTGHYCGATVDTLEEALDGIRSGLIAPRPLVRIESTIGPLRVPYPATNDILFCHESPAGSTRYLLRVGDRAELQVSSGIWISTASGSTGAMLSAGGQAMAPDDPRLQFRVREPYLVPNRELCLLGGYADELKLVSRSPRNAIFIDGRVFRYKVDLATVLWVRRAADPLWVYGYRAGVRERA